MLRASLLQPSLHLLSLHLSLHLLSLHLSLLLLSLHLSLLLCLAARLLLPPKGRPLHQRYTYIPLSSAGSRPLTQIHVLFCFVLFCFVLFCFVLFCFVLFCFALLRLEPFFKILSYTFDSQGRTVAAVFPPLRPPSLRWYFLTLKPRKRTSLPSRKAPSTSSLSLSSSYLFFSDCCCFFFFFFVACGFVQEKK